MCFFLFLFLYLSVIYVPTQSEVSVEKHRSSLRSTLFLEGPRCSGPLAFHLHWSLSRPAAQLSSCTTPLAVILGIPPPLSHCWAPACWSPSLLWLTLLFWQNASCSSFLTKSLGILKKKKNVWRACMPESLCSTLKLDWRGIGFQVRDK